VLLLFIMPLLGVGGAAVELVVLQATMDAASIA
jgi:hypothetical protein